MKKSDPKVRTALIASGSGTDAEAIMKAYVNGHIPNIEIVSLISTKQDAGCLEKARNFNVETQTISSSYRGPEEFNASILSHLKDVEAKLVFLVGCIVRIFPIDGIKIYNIHPADINKFGGKGMYSLETHRRVLLDIIDQIKREKATVTDQFFTFPTIHEVTEKYDAGAPLLIGSVRVPNDIISSLMGNTNVLDFVAEELQKKVLRYEHIMLPGAVQMAAEKFLSELP